MVELQTGTGTLERAFAIIKNLSDAKAEGARVTQIAKDVGLTQGTVHRTLQALVLQNVVEQDERTKHYRLSVDFFVLAARAGNPLNLREICRPIMLRLCASLGDTLFLLARSGFDSSFNYRSATLFGICEEITGDEKVAQLDAFINKLIPGRAAELRASTEQEMKATTLLGMLITEASGKIRNGGVHDNPEDAQEKIWAGVLEVNTYFGDLHPDQDTQVIAEPSASLSGLTGKKL